MPELSAESILPDSLKTDNSTYTNETSTPETNRRAFSFLAEGKNIDSVAQLGRFVIAMRCDLGTDLRSDPELTEALRDSADYRAVIVETARRFAKGDRDPEAIRGARSLVMQELREVSTKYSEDRISLAIQMYIYSGKEVPPEYVDGKGPAAKKAQYWMESAKEHYQSIDEGERAEILNAVRASADLLRSELDTVLQAHAYLRQEMQKLPNK